MRVPRRPLAFAPAARRGLAFVLAAGAAGCGAFQPPAPKPFVPPTSRAEVTHFAGSALTGPTTRPVPAVPADQALAVRVRFVALENAPAGGGQPLAGAARLITADRLGAPVRASAQLTRLARLVPLADPDQVSSAVVRPTGGRSAELSAGTAAVAPGVTAAFVLTDPAPPGPRAGGPGASPRIELYVTRPEPVGPAAAVAPGAVAPAAANSGLATAPAAGVPVELALVVQGVAPLPPDETPPAEEPAAAAAAPPAAEAFQREVALVDRQVDGRDVLCVVLPYRFAGSSAAAVAVVVDLARDPGSPAHLDAMSRAVEDGRRSAEQVLRRPAPDPLAPAGGRDAAGLSAAVGGLAAVGPGGGGAATPAGADLRAALVYLAGQAAAPLCEDVALVADDVTLAALAGRARAALGASPAAGASPGVGGAATAPSTAAVAGAASGTAAAGWALDKAAFDLLGQLVANGRLPPELAAVLAAHAGEAGRHPSSVEEIGRSAAGRQDFQNRLVAENLIYLEDSSPSARVRAFDWLAARGKAPTGFDPLGPARDRRAALDRAANGPDR